VIGATIALNNQAKPVQGGNKVDRLRKGHDVFIQ